MKNIELPAGDLTLKLVSELPDSPHWISVFIQEDRESMKLGADIDDIIVSRFLPLLNLDSPPPEENTKIEGIFYAWLTTFSEVHTFFFGRRNSSGGVDICVKGGFTDGKDLHLSILMNLSPEECRIWVQRLNELLNE